MTTVIRLTGAMLPRHNINQGSWLGNEEQSYGTSAFALISVSGHHEGEKAFLDNRMMMVLT